MRQGGCTVEEAHSAHPAPDKEMRADQHEPDQRTGEARFFGRFTCEVYARAEDLSASDWRRLFPGFPSAAARIHLNERAGADGFVFRSIVVKEQGRVILCVPLFEMTYNLSSVIQGRARAFAVAAVRWWPSVLAPRILGVGFVGGEEGRIGHARDLDSATLDAAWDLALEALEALAQRIHAAFLVFANFTSESGRWVPMHKCWRFTQVKSLPYCTLPIVYESLEGYLAALSKSTRKDLRRKLRQAEGIEIQRTREPSPWLDTMYHWYRRTVERSEVVFGTQRREYFEQVCRVVPGAEFVLYFRAGTLLAFNLVIVTPERLVDQYFCMDDDLGRHYALYFISWLENIRYCIAHRIPRYDANQGAEHTKGRLRVEMIPSLVLFRHRNPILHRLLTICLQRFACHPPDDLPTAQLGLGWHGPRAHEPWKPRGIAINPQGILSEPS